MKKLSCLSLAFVFLFLLCACGENEKADGVYAFVNSEPLSTQEIDFYTSRLRTKVITEFSEKYGISDFSDFWDNEYDGVTPKSVLEERAVQSAVEAKLKLIEMKKYGIYADISWDGLKKQAEQYNKSHAGKNAVGLKSIDMSGFYIYYLSTGEIELKKKLLSDGIGDYDKYIENLVKNAQVVINRSNDG